METTRTNVYPLKPSTSRRVLLAPDGCTKYYAPAEFDLDAFAEWCLTGNRTRPAAGAWADLPAVEAPANAA